MSRTNLARIVDTPPREREHLRQAIRRHAAAAERHAKIAAAQERASAAASEAYTACRRASATLDEARQNESHFLTAAALGEADAASNPVDAASRALAQAEAAREAAERTQVALASEATAAANELRSATSTLNDAVRDVLRAAPEVQQLKADLDVARRAVADVANKLLSLPHGVAGTVIWGIDDLRPGERPDAAWSAAIAALAKDADAPLPQS